MTSRAGSNETNEGYNRWVSLRGESQTLGWSIGLCRFCVFYSHCANLKFTIMNVLKLRVACNRQATPLQQIHSTALASNGNIVLATDVWQRYVKTREKFRAINKTVSDTRWCGSLVSPREATGSCRETPTADTSPVSAHFVFITKTVCRAFHLRTEAVNL